MRTEDDKSRYDDIINLPRRVSERHPPMSLYDRAAQFTPFAALTGYDDAVDEAARLTDTRITLDEHEKDALGARLNLLADNPGAQPEVSVMYFLPDTRKSGGSYVTISGAVKSVDDFERRLLFTDGRAVPIDDIIRINGDIFDSCE